MIEKKYQEIDGSCKFHSGNKFNNYSQSKETKIPAYKNKFLEEELKNLTDLERNLVTKIYSTIIRKNDCNLI